MRGGAGNDFIYGQDSNDTLDGGADNDFLVGDAGDDTLNGGAGADTLRGEAGNDLFIDADLPTEIDSYHGGADNDTLRSTLNFGTGVTFSLLNGMQTETSGGTTTTYDTFSEIENLEIGGSALLIGDFGDNTLIATSTLSTAHNTINGLAGNDTLKGGGGGDDDSLYGESGDDFLRGDDGDDRLEGGAGSDTLEGGLGDDVLVDIGLPIEIDSFDGGVGNDTLAALLNFTADVTFDLATGTQTITSGGVATSCDTFTNIENLSIGGAATIRGDGNANKLVGTSGLTTAANTIFGLGGDDQIEGNGGNDTLYSGDGDDDLLGGTGNDTLLGGEGDDTVDGSQGDDVFIDDEDLQNRRDYYIGGAGNDTLVYSRSPYDDGDMNWLTVDLATGETRYGVGAYYLVETFTGIENLSATTGNIFGDHNDNILSSYNRQDRCGILLDGRGGNDTLNGSRTSDSLTGGSGNDALYGDEGNDTLNGGAGDDVLDGGAGADAMAGGIGNDTYTVDDAGDSVVEAAGEGTDEVRTGLASLALSATVENLTGTSSAGQTLTGNDLDNIITGADGNDAIRGLDGNDTLTGGAGADNLNGDAGADTMAGGTGDDTYTVDDASDIVTEVADEGTDEVRTGLATYALGLNLENLTGTAATGQTLTGNALANVITGAGNDSLDGGAGADTMAGGTGDDTYTIDDIGDSVTEAAGEGTDEVRTGLASLALGANVENLTGTAATGQALTGNELANVITGVGGNDALYGDNGNDLLQGNDGNDRLFGGSGNDKLYGGAGSDTCYGGAGNDRLYMDDGDDTLDGGSDVDWLYITGSPNCVVDLAETTGQDTGYGTDIIKNIEHVYGGTGADKLYGTNAANTLKGNDGNDILKGRTGNDKLYGGNGNDKLYGGNSNDLLKGGTGQDKLDGGSGRDLLYAGADTDRDVFVFSDIAETVTGAQRDRIYQFHSGEDVIHLRKIDADTSLAGDQSFLFSESGPAANAIWIQDSGSDVIVRGDVDGDASQDFEILVVRVDALNAGDFVL